MARARRTEYIPLLVRFELRIEIYQYEWRRRNDYFNQKGSLVDDSDSSKSTDTPKSKPIFHLLKNIRPWNVASRRRCCVALRDVGVIPPAYFLQITGVTVPVICPCANSRGISGFDSQRVTTWDARSLTRIPVVWAPPDFAIDGKSAPSDCALQTNNPTTALQIPSF